MADTKISALTAASALTGTEIVPVVQSAANRRTTAQDIADLAAAGGLFSPILSAVPTTANTGLSTWLNQGTASVADSAVGVAITDSNQGALAVRGRTKASPSTPYTLTALIAVNGNPTDFISGGLGWYNGTDKLHTLALVRSSGWIVTVQKLNSVSAFFLNDFASGVGFPMLVWFQIEDDGTNVIFRFSIDGANFIQAFSVAKASGFLGGSGYSNVVFFANPQGAAVSATLMSLTQS